MNPYRRRGDVSYVGTTREGDQLLLHLRHTLLPHVILVGGRNVIHDLLLVVREDFVDSPYGGCVLLLHVLVKVVVALLRPGLVLQRRGVTVLFGLLAFFCVWGTAIYFEMV